MLKLEELLKLKEEKKVPIIFREYYQEISQILKDIIGIANILDYNEKGYLVISYSEDKLQSKESIESEEITQPILILGINFTSENLLLDSIKQFFNKLPYMKVYRDEGKIILEIIGKGRRPYYVLSSLLNLPQNSCFKYEADQISEATPEDIAKWVIKDFKQRKELESSKETYTPLVSKEKVKIKKVGYSISQDRINWFFYVINNERAPVIIEFIKAQCAVNLQSLLKEEKRKILPLKINIPYPFTLEAKATLQLKVTLDYVDLNFYNSIKGKLSTLQPEWFTGVLTVKILTQEGESMETLAIRF